MWMWRNVDGDGGERGVGEGSKGLLCTMTKAKKVLQIVYEVAFLSVDITHEVPSRGLI